MIIYNLQEFYHLVKFNQPIIAIDYGEKKVGIAISSPNHATALPLKVINSVDKPNKINAVRDLIKLHLVGSIVIGLPLRMNGEKGEQAQLAQSFAESLSKAVKLPIYLQDERLTSKAADNLLKIAGFNRQRRNQMDDLIAAMLILETTLASMALLHHHTKQN